MTSQSIASGASGGLKNEWWMPRLAGPLILAAVVRFGLLAIVLARNGTSTITHSDTLSYLEPGRNLLLHGRFVVDGIPDLFRTPAYPLFLALFSLPGLTVAAAANVLLSVFSVLLVWKLGRTVFGNDRIALGAAWLFALEPISVAISAFLLSDTLFLACLLLSMERLTAFLRGHSLRVLAVAGLCLTAATFVRPVTYYLPVTLALGLFLVLLRVPGLRWKAPAVLLLSVLPWLAVWQMRNRLETGYSGFSSVTDVNLYFYNAADLTAHLEHRPFLDVRKELGHVGGKGYGQQAYLYPSYLNLHPEQAAWNQGQRLAYMHAEAVKTIKAHYGAYLHCCVIMPFFTTLFNPGAGFFDSLLVQGDAPAGATAVAIANSGPVLSGINLVKAHPLVATEKGIFAVWLLGLYVYAVQGVVRADKQNPCLWLMLGISLYFLGISGAGGGPGADARYRMPVMPVVCIFAAAGVWRTRKPVR